jgi:hypothetical protein
VWVILGLLVLAAGGGLAAAIIKIATPKGTLVIESDDPDVEVVVKKDGAVVVDKTKDREITLKVGENYTIELAEGKGGLKRNTDKFDITRNGKTTVRVRVDKPKEAARAVPPGVVDLLALIDPTAHVVGGRWRTEGGRLISGGRDGATSDREKLRVPFDPPAEYDLTAVVERTHVGATRLVEDRARTITLLLSGPHLFQVVLDWDMGGKVFAGFVPVGKSLNENDTLVPADVFAKGGPVRVDCRVRRDSVVVQADGREVLRWSGDLTRLGVARPYWNFPDGTRLGLGTQNAEYRVRELTLTPAAGTSPAAPARFEEVHGASPKELQEWAAKLPKGYRPSWFTARAHGPEPRFDAVAVEVHELDDWKLIVAVDPDDAPWKLWTKTHRPAASIRYKNGDRSETMFLYVQDGRDWEFWVGDQPFVGGKIEEGLKNERPAGGGKENWLPGSLAAYQDGDGTHYNLVQAWLPHRTCEWSPELDPDELAKKVAEYRAKGWRPHLVNVHHGRDPVRFAAVFVENPANEPWEFTPGLTVAEYEKQLADRKAKGYRPRCVCSYLAAGKVEYTVVWDGVGVGPAKP